MGYLIDFVYISNLIAAPRPVTRPSDPCQPSPCGANAVCTERNRAAACQCIPDYHGDPYVGCRPECVVHSDCPANRACSQRHKCVDPCPGTCGRNAVCRVMNHVPTCSCTEGYTGDPFTACRLVPVCKCLYTNIRCKGIIILKLYSKCPFKIQTITHSKTHRTLKNFLA